MQATNSINRQAAAEMAYTSRAYEPVEKQPAKAEKRRVMAIAADQENSAKVKEMEAKHIKALAAVPQAILAKILRAGKAGSLLG